METAGKSPRLCEKFKGRIQRETDMLSREFQLKNKLLGKVLKWIFWHIIFKSHFIEERVCLAILATFQIEKKSHKVKWWVKIDREEVKKSLKKKKKEKEICFKIKMQINYFSTIVIAFDAEKTCTYPY